MKTKNYIGLLIYIFLLICTTIQHKCGSDKAQKEHKPKSIYFNSTKKTNLRNMENNVTPLKIVIESSAINYYVTTTTEYKTKTLNLLKEVADSLEKLINVYNHEHIFLDNAFLSFCVTGGDKIIRRLNKTIDGGEDGDLIIIPVFNTKTMLGEGVIASAYFCGEHHETKRPVVGVINLGTDMNFSKLNAELEIKYTILHEITHVLGFSYNKFDDFASQPVVEEVDNKFYIVSTNAFEMAKKYFNCENLIGIELEQQGDSGTAGSHWEARLMLGDYMVGMEYDDVTISEITLAFLEDSGWYKVNYYTGGLFKFGKNKGCDFINNNCVKTENKIHITLSEEEFCVKPNQEKCLSSLINKGQCAMYRYNDPIPREFTYFNDNYIGGMVYANYCPVAISPDDNRVDYYYNCKVGRVQRNSFFEVIGDNSMCFELEINKDQVAVCYEVKCNTEKKKFTIIINNKEYLCNDGQKIIIEDIGILKCPNYNRLCIGNIFCNELFECIDKKAYVYVSELSHNTNIITTSKSFYVNYGYLFFIIYIYAIEFMI